MKVTKFLSRLKKSSRETSAPEKSRQSEEPLYRKIERGYVEREDGTKIILQGFHPNEERENRVVNLNHYLYRVDNQLVLEGWMPQEPIPLDRTYFKRRADRIEAYRGYETRIEKSRYLRDRKPCMVLYLR